MPAVQNHGFVWEAALLSSVYGVSEADRKGIGYTNKTDLPAALNRLDSVDLSIKAAGHRNAICMGNCLSIYDAVSSGTPLHMTVIHYEQDDAAALKRLRSITEVDLTASAAALFGDITRAELEQLDRAVKAVPQKRYPTPEEHAAMYAIQKALLLRCRAIHLDIKCDKQQSRLQCSFSFNRFQQFLRDHPERIVAQSTTGEFRGGRIVEEVASARRVLKKKAAPSTPDSAPPSPPPSTSS
jgi:hypothetical protein